MSNILITGGAGFIGSEMAKKLSEHNDQIIVVDNLLTGKKENVPEEVKFIKCDVNDYKDISSIFYSYNIDYVFHYAAMVGVQRTLANPLLVFDDIKGIKNILKLSKNTGVKHIYYSSSSEIYGEPVEIPQREDTTPLNTKLPYAVVKNFGELYLKAYQKEHGLNYTIFRFFNTYGKKQAVDFVVSKFIEKAINDEDILIYGNGDQSRTFFYIDDNIKVCSEIFYRKLFINETINIGSDFVMNINTLASTIILLTQSKSKIVYTDPLKEGDMSQRKPDVTKIKELMPNPVRIGEGIKKLL